ncbi:hypothetical protein GCM10010278_73350 [Streptomyces melanogenes]|nr:hypothetical protein GCM10010278_73350 [Streptomyces melanogenes]
MGDGRDAYAVTHREPLDPVTQGRDHSGTFVSEGEGHGHSHSPIVAFPTNDMDIGAANPRRLDVDNNPTRPGLGIGHLCQPQRHSPP